MTWRYLLARLVSLYRLWRLTFRYCAACGVPLMPDETTTCAECIEYEQVEREQRAKMQAEMERQQEQRQRQFAMQGFAGYGFHAFAPPVFSGSAKNLQGIPMTPEEWDRWEKEFS